MRKSKNQVLQGNEEDRLAIVTFLIKCGYTARITHRTIPGTEDKKNAQKEYIIEYWEE